MLKFRVIACVASMPMLCLSACSDDGAGGEAAAEITPGNYEIKLGGKGIMGMLDGPGSKKEFTRCLSSEDAENLSEAVFAGLSSSEADCESTGGTSGVGTYSGNRTCSGSDTERGSAMMTFDYTGRSTPNSFHFDVKTAISTALSDGKTFGSSTSLVMTGKRVGDCDSDSAAETVPDEPDESYSDENSEATEAADAAASAAENEDDDTGY